MNPQNPQPSQPPAQMDQSVINLAKSIRQVESGGNFNAKGKSGESGAYQWTPETWKAHAQEALGNPNAEMTPSNQNAVAYTVLKKWKDSGLNPAQIAAKWNSGSETGWENKVSTGYGGKLPPNSHGVEFNVPKYVKSVTDAYQTIKNGGQVSADPNNPSSIASKPINEGSKEETYGALIPAADTDTPLDALGKGIANTPSSLLNLGKGLVTAVSHPIKTVEGLAGVIAGGASKLGRKLGTGSNVGQPETKEEQTFNALADSLKSRYGSLDNARKTAVNDPVGFGADVLSVLEGGANLLDRGLGTTAEELAKVGGLTTIPENGKYAGLLDDTLSKGASVVTKPLSAVAGAGYKLGTGILGTALGVDGGTIREGVSSALKGGDAYKSFVDGLKGNATPEELVDQAKNALGEIKDTRRTNYQEMLSNLKDDPATYDVSPVLKELDKQLGDFNIVKNSDGTLDFSRSTLRFNKSAQSDINTIVEEMKGFGTKPGDRTAVGIDKLKQSFYDLDQPSSKARSLTSAVAKKTRDVLENAPGYTQAMKDYADMSEQINDITKGLSLGDNAMVETSFKKLISAFKQNNEFRAQLIKELDQVSGGQIIPKIAGQQLSSWTSRGLMGTLERAGGVGSIVSTGGATFLPVLGTMMATSPKLVGNLIRTLRLPSEAVNKIMPILSKMTTPAVLGSNALNRVQPGLIK